ncbi:hypothetical protein [Bowmanella denitrificans]|uniref:hypothetical protein n=1 Tax=Bowmanella denitrificans TaxID=366582 RepID=UPI000C9C06A2|nr:hypothetical protein [Bowmanella denitrificans]
MIETLIPAFIPVLSDGVRALVNRFTGSAGAKPANVGEVIQLMQADTEKLKALAELDRTGNVSLWVANIRALQRPVIGLSVITGYVVAVNTGASPETQIQLGQYASMVTFYLFGDRTWQYIRGRN